MITGKEIKVLDQNADYYGVPTHKLMENAGKGIADYINNHLKPKNKKILILCGTGNNGGDGFVAARHLHPRYNLSVFLTGEEHNIITDISKHNFTRLKKNKIPIFTLKNLSQLDNLLKNHDIIIDSMLGIGLHGTLREPFHTIVKKINTQTNKTIIAVDTPTGLGTNLAIQPQHTTTFHDIKTGMNQQNSGTIHIVDIGIPKPAINFVGPGELKTYYPRPHKHSHKGDNGIVLIIGGGPYTGAPALAGLAAHRTGADLIHIATPQISFPIVASFSPNFIVHRLTNEKLTINDIPLIQPLIKKATAIILGPGLGTHPETVQTIPQLIQEITVQNKPLIVDADGLQPLAQHHNLLKNTQTVVTPHIGEFKKLFNEPLQEDLEAQKKQVKTWAKKIGITILLKGSTDIISNGTYLKLNRIHNEAMTVGGTGDVLAGIVGALLSKNVEPYNAARIAAFLNGEAGNHVFKTKSYGLVATDIIETLPLVLKNYL